MECVALSAVRGPARVVEDPEQPLRAFLALRTWPVESLRGRL